MQRRRYYSNDCGLTNCPECGKSLIKEGCSIIMWVKSDKEDMELMTSLSGSHFCQNCPVDVFDIDILEQAVMIGLKGAEDIRYSVRGIVNFDAIPKEKRHLETV